MKIDKIVLRNFCGIKGEFTLDMPKIAALIGPNGMGKTTVLNAIRYALTGAEPEGDIINKDCDFCDVRLYLTDPFDGVCYEFIRTKSRTAPSKFKIEGKATTLKAMNDKIESIIGIPLDKIKILASSDVVAAMKPQDFSKFILDYVPQKFSRDTLISYIPGCTIGMIDIVEARLPENDLMLKDLDEFRSDLEEERKQSKNSLAAKQAMLSELPEEDPGFDKKALEAELKKLLDNENAYKMYLAKKQAYETVVNARKKQDAIITEAEKEYNSISISKPDVAALNALLNEQKKEQESVQNLRASYKSTKDAVAQLKDILDSLSKPICPISATICCKTDKTAAKAEIEETILSTETSLAAIAEEGKKAADRLSDVEIKVDAYHKDELLYNKKIELAKTITALKKDLPEIPELPEEVVKADVEDELFQIKNKIKQQEDYIEGQKLLSVINTMKINVADLDGLVKAFAEKGAVKTAIVNSYLQIFEDLCNDKSSKVRPDVDFKFVSDGGIVVLMNNGKGAYLPYASLSGGERAYMIFILMDMLNTLTGTNLLLMDELSVVDQKCFDALLDLVTSNAANYDHILVAAVNHEDTVKSVIAHSINMIELNAAA